VGPQVLGFLLPIVSVEDRMNTLLGHLEGVPDDLVGETLLTEFGDLLD